MRYQARKAYAKIQREKFKKKAKPQYYWVALHDEKGFFL
jgi:hypothetical protein